MIIDRIENAQQYAFLGKAWKTAFDAIQNFDSASFEKGKHPIEDGVTLVHIETQTRDRNALKLEAHRRYADVMFLTEGAETLYWKPTADLKEITSEYNPEIEALLATHDDDTMSIPFAPGLFVVFLPQDAHAADGILDEVQTVRRIVVKVPLD